MIYRIFICYLFIYSKNLYPASSKQAQGGILLSTKVNPEIYINFFQINKQTILFYGDFITKKVACFCMCPNCLAQASSRITGIGTRPHFIFLCGLEENGLGFIIPATQTKSYSYSRFQGVLPQIHLIHTFLPLRAPAPSLLQTYCPKISLKCGSSSMWYFFR